MTRPAAWPEILASEIRAAREHPAEWGRHDCFTWAARVVRRLGGPNLAALVPAWTDEAGVQRAIAARGAGLEAAMVSLCAEAGMQAVPPLMAQRGDLVVLRAPGGPLCGVCDGRNAMAAAITGGVSPVPMTLCLRAWAV